ncbi:MAG: class IV adenylate cyclase [Candidatus Woesearchaeota archaeon]|nr:class IV adenylate cyclase [Candidatus Woesearchaeota archaeon]
MEVELKFFAIEKDEIITKLEEIGATKEFESTVEDVCFENAHTTYKNAEANLLRLRTMNGNIFLTAKGPRIPGPMKTREETEVEVVDYEAMKNLLEQLGYTPTPTHTKKRTHFTHTDAHFEIDEHDFCPPFLEIETTSAEAMRTVCAKLDIDIEKGDKRTIMELYPERFQ